MNRLAVLQRHLVAGQLHPNRQNVSLEQYTATIAAELPFVAQLESTACDELFELLDEGHHDTRKAVHGFCESNKDLFHESYCDSLPAFRERGFARLAALLKQRFVSCDDLLKNVGKYFAFVESINCNELGATIAVTIQFNLFGACVAHLGTDAQRQQYFEDVSSGNIICCFALSELGHGTNAAGVATKAVFDVKRDGFIISTPTTADQKYWIGLSGQWATHAVVMARLITADGDHGVHAFVVRLRNEIGGVVLPGITIKDCGKKMGLQAVDNGRLFFDNVFVPRDALLARHAHVDLLGKYSSPLSSSERFAAVMSGLVIARIVVGTGSAQIARVGLDIAIRYAHSRKQFGPPKSDEVSILTYPLQQLQLMPELAKTYGITFLVNDCKRVYAAYLAKPTKELNRQVHLFACIVKAFGSWYNTESLQVCREACGGQGFLLRNLIAALRTESEIFTTFDGANRPLCLSAARLILEKFAAKAGAWDVIVSEFHNWCGYFEGNSSIAEAGTLHRLFELREHALTYQCAQLLRKDRSFDAFNASAPLLVKLAQAHTEKRVLEAFLSRVKILEKKKSAAAPVLRDLMVLYGLHCATADAYFVTEGLVSASAFRKAQVEKQEYCGKVTKYSLSLVKAFKTPSWVLEPTIANDWVAINARDNDVM